MPDAHVQRITRALERGVLAFAVVVVAVQIGAPGWGRASELTTAAHQLAPGVAPGSPGHALVGKLASLVPIGDVAFRVAAVSAVAILAALAGLIALGRALVPDERIAGSIAAAVGVTAPAILAAGTTAGPDAIVAALVVWSTAFAVRARRGEATAVPAMALAVATLAFQPVVGLAVAATIGAAVIRTRVHALVTVALVAAVLPIWALVVARPGEVADLPGWLTAGVSVQVAGTRAADLVTALGHGTGGPLLLAGVVGLGFGAVTGLRGAPLPLLVASGALVASVTVGGGPERAAPTMILLASGLAPLAGAIARSLAKQPTERSRVMIGVAASAPVVMLALIAPPVDLVDPGGDQPSSAARSVILTLPAGPGAVVLGEDALWSGARLEQAVGGERPDLTVVPRVPGAMVLAVNALRAGRVVGSDVAAFERLDPRLAAPRDRGFQLLLEAPAGGEEPRPPPRWTGATGEQLAERVGLARASFEAGMGRLDGAAIAAGLVASGRFDAGDLALLHAATPTAARPALYGYIPPLSAADRLGIESLLFGDDLAWVAGLDVPEATADDVPERRLAAAWRGLLTGSRVPEDPGLFVFGREAEIATAVAMLAVGRKDLARRAAAAALVRGADARLREILEAAAE